MVPCCITEYQQYQALNQSMLDAFTAFTANPTASNYLALSSKLLAYQQFQYKYAE